MSASDAFKAILFDLDGTLLDSDATKLLQHYLQALAARFSDVVPRKQFIAALLHSTDMMMANDGRVTNEKAFDAAFFPMIGRTRAELEPIFTDFYARDYRALERFTRRKPGAREAVELAFALGYEVAIATMPVFPRVAVDHRLAWAGVGDFPYRLITTYENSHFCKPNPGYFREIAAHLGCRPEECLVVGDEGSDMAAGRAGCTTFLIPGPATAEVGDMPAPAYRGDLADLVALLRTP